MTDATGYVELARIHRGEVVESTHRGAVVVSDWQGRIRASWGSAGLVTYPRSSLKPFQAMALVESGAADAFGLDDEHLALACASHRAEPFQVALVRGWLERLGLTEQALVCGPALPVATADMAGAFASGGPRRVYHNCSGKHCGFLTVARHLGGRLDYADPAHPAQILYRDILSEFLGRDAAALPCGVDNCGLPAIAVPLRLMARAAARLGVGYSARPARLRAALRVRAAMLAHPDHLQGADQPTARLMRAAGGRLLLKSGAEGFLIAAAPQQGLGFAIKVADGAARVKYGVLARLLGRFGVLPEAEAEALIAAVEPPTLDSNGQQVGHTEIVLGRPPARRRRAGLALMLQPDYC